MGWQDLILSLVAMKTGIFNHLGQTPPPPAHRMRGLTFLTPQQDSTLTISVHIHVTQLVSRTHATFQAIRLVRLVSSGELECQALMKLNSYPVSYLK